MGKYDYPVLKPTYTPLWEQAKVTKVAEANKQAKLLLTHKAVYQQVERRTGVPWWAVGVIHLREAGPSDVGTWKRVLHNGERIVGTGRKTRLVPAGRGPFTDWHDAAFDALVTIKHLDKVKDWGAERVCHVLESFNGFGYRNKGIPSPYLWGGTSVQKRGKYVADGKYDPNVMDTQLGGMAVLKQLMVLDPTISFKAIKPTAQTVKIEQPIIGPETGTTLGTAGTGVVVLTQTPIQYWPYVIAGTLAAMIFGLLIVRWYKKRTGKK